MMSKMACGAFDSCQVTPSGCVAWELKWNSGTMRSSPRRPQSSCVTLDLGIYTLWPSERSYSAEVTAVLSAARPNLSSQLQRGPVQTYALANKLIPMEKHFPCRFHVAPWYKEKATAACMSKRSSWFNVWQSPLWRLLSWHCACPHHPTRSPFFRGLNHTGTPLRKSISHSLILKTEHCFMRWKLFVQKFEFKWKKLYMSKNKDLL